MIDIRAKGNVELGMRAKAQPKPEEIDVNTDIMRLNPNQVAHWASKLPKWIEAYDGFSIKCILERRGLWQRLVDDGLVEGRAKHNIIDDSPEQQLYKVQQALYERSMKGDAQAARAFTEMLTADKAKEAFNVEVNIVPYEIKDKSLKRIVYDADEGPVNEIITSWIERIHEDGCPANIVRLSEQLFDLWSEWAKDAYQEKPSSDITPQEEEKLTIAKMEAILDKVMTVKGG